MKQWSITTPPEWDARLLHSPFSPPPPPFQHDPLTIQQLPFKLMGGESHCVKKFFQKAFKGYKIFAFDFCLKRQKWVQHWIIYPNFTFSWKPIYINMHYLSSWDARLPHSPLPPFQHDPLTIQQLPFKLEGGESHCVKTFFHHNYTSTIKNFR